MNAPRFALVPVQGHEIHVTEWGDPGQPGLVLWHGLARTGRDFDELAEALSEAFFVLCPDTIGRGMSSWAKTPEVEYSIAHYAAIATGLLDHYGLARVAWLGTSMGGMIGMRLASGPHADRLRCLILNDIGPEIPTAAIDRILAYVGDLPSFANVSEGEAWLREAYLPFGPASDVYWRRMALTSVRRRESGDLTLHYDPKIVVQFTASPDEVQVWERYARIKVPTHIFRGGKSDLLTAGIAARMQQSGPKPGLTVLGDCGHAPSLTRPDDIARVRQVLRDLL
ncbi:alpha/beta fold hydrolase [Pseudooceanicola spongiae]|uniref:Alpha/beta fold hydrolase n=1 Tax=Pseudooceanicola spongiae TaxID=2613965 RepID=A0A7L9WPC6_9RHOB|nr:alpha/beta hydrolase [Pseudooceanicola spongiae]QOL81266.1 alpha/beta fold hydrolase [Pseudooceanicola spongiae]